MALYWHASYALFSEAQRLPGEWQRFPIFWRQASIEYVARHIIRGEPYKIEVLMRQIPAVEAEENSTFCRPIALWSAAIIRLRIVEQASSNKEGKPIDAASHERAR